MLKKTILLCAALFANPTASYAANNPLENLIASLPKQCDSISITYLPPFSKDYSAGAISFFKAMFGDPELPKRNFSEGYLKSLYERAAGDVEKLPQIFLGDAQERGLHYLFLEESTTCFGYFSFWAYDAEKVPAGHPLRTTFEVETAVGHRLWNVGVFLLPEYRGKGFFKAISEAFEKAVVPSELENNVLSLSIDSDHPILHTYLSKHSYGFTCLGQNADKSKTFYLKY